MSEVCAATAALYESAGFASPWINDLVVSEAQVVGACGFKGPPVSDRVEIAYFTFPGFERRGIASRMAQELLALARAADPNVVVTAQTLRTRSASTRILKKVGFELKREGVHHAEVKSGSGSSAPPRWATPGCGSQLGGDTRMRKRIARPAVQDAVPLYRAWLDVEGLAQVEITSEETAHPIESALMPGRPTGWCAAEPGPETIRLLFARPQPLRLIRVSFEETRVERTQEYVLRWSPDGGQSSRDIVRQQWNFSPRGATSQTEEHQVELPAVTVLELTVTPDISGGTARASLAALRLA